MRSTTREDSQLSCVSVIALQARISETTPRDLQGIALLTDRVRETLGAEPSIILGRQGPFGHTPWKEDLEASRDVLTQAGERLSEALAGETGPSLTLGTDCALAVATLPVVARLYPQACVLWLDAHCDFDTPSTTTIGFLGCMSLAGACGRWDTGFGPAMQEGRVVLCGTRPRPDDFDIAAQRAVEESDVTLVGISEASMIEEILMTLRGAPVYLHLDPDVLDPAVFPIPYARPHGLSAAGLQRLLETVAAHNPVVGVEITAFHAPDDATRSSWLARFLVDAVVPLL